MVDNFLNITFAGQTNPLYRRVPQTIALSMSIKIRQRKHYVESRNRETNRIHKILQSGGIKLTTYIEDIMGASGRNLLQLLIDETPLTPRMIHQSVYIVT